MNVIGQLCPIFKGVGYSAIMMVFLENVYYVIIVAWTMFYIANIFYNIGDDLPWTTCEQGSKLFFSVISHFSAFNDKYMYLAFSSCIYLQEFCLFFSDGTWANSKCFNPEGNITFNQSAAFLKHGLSENVTESPVEQYWK